VTRANTLSLGHLSVCFANFIGGILVEGDVIL